MKEMFIIISVEEKYKVGKGRGKPAILNRMIREGLSDKCKRRPKDVRYIWDKKEASRGKGRTGRLMRPTRKELIGVDPAGLWAPALRFSAF